MAVISSRDAPSSRGDHIALAPGRSGSSLCLSSTASQAARVDSARDDAMIPPRSRRAAGYRAAGLERKAEHLGEAAPAGRRDDERAAVAHALEPAKVEAACGERGAHRAGEMRPPLGPVEARPAEGAAALLRRGEVEAELGEEIDAALGDLAALVGEHDMAALDQGVGEADAEAAGEMIVAGAGIAQRRVELAGRAVARRTVGGDRHDALDHAADRRCRQAVVAVAPPASAAPGGAPRSAWRGARWWSAA